MNLESLQDLSSIIIPVVGQLGELINNIAKGIRSTATARADLKNILVTALDRLSVAEANFAKRDADEDARVAALSKLPEPTKP